MYDSRTSNSAYWPCRFDSLRHVLPLWSSLRAFGVLCFFAHGPLAFGQFSRQATVNQTTTNAFSLGTRGVIVTATNPTTSSIILYGGTSSTASTGIGAVGAGATVTFTVGQFTATQLTSDMGGAIGSQLFTWNGLSSSNTSTMGNAPSVGKTIYFRWGTGSVFSHLINVPPATLAVTLVSSTGTYINFNHPPDSISLNAANNNVVVASTNDEMMMFLNNRTGKEQTIRWGDKALTLAPGINQFRYDGPKDANGLPAVKPSDFAGTVVSGGGGSGGSGGSYQGTSIFANLDPSIEGTGVKWGLPPLLAPNAPSATQDVVEIISHPTATSPGLTAIRHASGLTTLVGTPAIPQKTPSNTTGTGAVISDPTIAKPAQTTTNTTTNTTTINTTNNTSNTSSTVINNAGQPAAPGVSYNTGGMDGIPVEAEGGVHDATVASYTQVGDRLSAGQGGTKNVVTAKVDNFKNLLASTTVPKLMAYNQSLTIPGFGSYALNIDFTKQPFPAVRTATLVVITLLMAMSLLKRLTI